MTPSTREQAVLQAGLSEPLTELALGRHPHDLFFFRCQEVPPEVPAPGAPLPLWQCGGWVTAARIREGQLEFSGHSLEAPEEEHLFARSEQGLWANLFSDLVEDEDWEEEAEEAMQALEEAAEEVGFESLGALLAFQEAHAEDEDYAERLAAWTLTL